MAKRICHGCLLAEPHIEVTHRVRLPNANRLGPYCRACAEDVARGHEGWVVEKIPVYHLSGDSPV